MWSVSALLQENQPYGIVDKCRSKSACVYVQCDLDLRLLHNIYTSRSSQETSDKLFKGIIQHGYTDRLLSTRYKYSTAGNCTAALIRCVGSKDSGQQKHLLCQQQILLYDNNPLSIVHSVQVDPFLCWRHIKSC